MKYCKKCQAETERYANGKCKPCARVRGAAWRAANPERAKEYGAANADAIALRKAAYRVDNLERLRGWEASWRKANPKAKLIHVQNRRARKHANGGVLSKDISERLFKLQKGKCPCCGKPLGDDYHLDHINPIILGGANEDWNIQLLRQQCNHQKHAKDPIDFMQSKGFLL